MKLGSRDKNQADRVETDNVRLTSTCIGMTAFLRGGRGSAARRRRCSRGKRVGRESPLWPSLTGRTGDNNARHGVQGSRIRNQRLSVMQDPATSELYQR